jgi:PIN domain nuclease of toxin-antitoxin system
VTVLLDTHTLLWAYLADPRLSAAAAAAITDPANTVAVSAATHWEVAIKMSTGKLRLRDSFPEFVRLAILDQGFTLLPIEPRHTAVLATLAYPPKHRDPFDRMLVAQALADGLDILSADDKLDAYGIRRVW